MRLLPNPPGSRAIRLNHARSFNRNASFIFHIFLKCSLSSADFLGTWRLLRALCRLVIVKQSNVGVTWRFQNSCCIICCVILYLYPSTVQWNKFRTSLHCRKIFGLLRNTKTLFVKVNWYKTRLTFLALAFLHGHDLRNTVFQSMQCNLTSYITQFLDTLCTLR